MSLPTNSPRRPIPVIPAASDAPPSLSTQKIGRDKPVPAITTTTTTVTTTTTTLSITPTSANDTVSASPLSPRLRNVSISPRPKPQSMRTLFLEKSPDSATEKSEAPDLKIRKPAMTIPSLSFPDVSTIPMIGQFSPRLSKAENLSPRSNQKSPRSDNLLFMKDSKSEPLFTPPRQVSKKSINALAMLLMQKIEKQLSESIELKLANSPDDNQQERGNQSALTEQMIKTLGRMDYKILVSTLPPELDYLNPNPTEKTVRFEQLLRGLFSEQIKHNGINDLVQLKKMQALLDHGHLNIAIGENDPQIRDQVMSSFKSYADAITAEIFGVDKKLEDCLLPTDLINNFLVPVDHMMLEMTLKNPKLSLKVINTARMNFLYDIVITRILMPLASADNKIEGTKGKEKWPSQLEIWLQSAVTLSLKKEWQNFFQKFIEKSNASLPQNLDKKINTLATQLATSRIEELQKNNSRYFGGSSSILLNVKENKDFLDSILKEMKISDIPSNFRKFLFEEDKNSPREKKQNSRLAVLSDFQEKAFKYQAKLDAAGKNIDPKVLTFSKIIKALLIQESKEMMAGGDTKPSRPKTTTFHKTDHVTLMRDIKKDEEALINAQLQATGIIPRASKDKTLIMTTTPDLSSTTNTKTVAHDSASEKS